MKFGSLFSGIEAASAAWLPLGWQCAWTAEIDPFACAVLRHHYPDTPNLGDVTKVRYAVEPIRWLGQRIATVDALDTEVADAADWSAAEDAP